MFIFQDEIFRTEDNRYYTKEYITHNGELADCQLGNDKVYKWLIGNREVQVFPDNEIKYEFDSGKKIRCNYSQLIRDDDSIIMCNNIFNYGDPDDISLENGDEYEEDGDMVDIFQFYIISNVLAYQLINHTDEIIYYHNELDIYILGVTHYGTSWDYVGTYYKL